jgi:hypothetical protein
VDARQGLERRTGIGQFASSAAGQTFTALLSPDATRAQRVKLRAQLESEARTLVDDMP